MGGYDNLEKLYECFSVVYENCIFLEPDSIIYKEPDRYVVFTSKKGTQEKHYYTDVKVNEQHDYIIAKSNGIWNLCDKYGKILLSFDIKDNNPKSYENLIVWWNNTNSKFRQSVLYSYNKGKITQEYKEQNGIINIFPNLRLAKSLNFITNWDTLITLDGQVLLKDKTQLQLTEEGYIISTEEYLSHIAIYKRVNQKVEKIIDYSDRFNLRSTKNQTAVKVFSSSGRVIFDRVLKTALEI